MRMTDQDYGKLVNERSKPSPMGKNLVWAFLVGGAICTAGQGLSNLYQSWGLDKERAGTAVSVTLILAAALLTGLGLFDKLAKRAGAGTLVPITGFANAMVSPALEFKSEGLVTGTAAKLFIVAGPVLVFGISASVVYGLILPCFNWPEWASPATGGPCRPTTPRCSGQSAWHRTAWCPRFSGRTHRTGPAGE